METYYIRFDRTNSDNLVLTQNGIIGKVINCPAVNNQCDIINLSNYISPERHVLKFPNVTLITDQELRYLYHREKLVDMIHKKQ